MFKRLFNRNNNARIEESNHLVSPVEGEIVNIESVDDPMFSSKALGDGIAIEPKNEIITAPANCKIVTASETMKHAIGLKLYNDIEVLIHIGIDTVSMNGEGFELLIKQDDIVKEGTPLVRFNKEKIINNGYKSTVLMIVTSPGSCENINYIREGKTKEKDVLVSW